MKDEDFKYRVFDWLMEIEEPAAAEFVNECELIVDYVDIAFDISNFEKEFSVCDVRLLTPAKFYKKLGDYKDLTDQIEDTIRELAVPNSLYIRDVYWFPGRTSYTRDKGKNSEEILEILNERYVKSQIAIMYESVNDRPHLTIGIAKELIETVCKTILLDKGIEVDKNWDLGRIVKETNKLLKFLPDVLENREKAERSVLKVLSGLSNLVQGITELRNNFGSGHGHEPTFQGLDKVYAKLAADSSSELVLFYLKIHNQSLR